MRRSFLFSLVLCAVLLTVGCSQSFKDLRPLRQQIIQEYQEEDIVVQLQNGNTVGVSLTNTSFNDLSEVEKEAKAREIAQFVKDHYQSVDSIDRIFVGFIVYKKYFFVVNYTNSLDTFFFDIEELN